MGAIFLNESPPIQTDDKCKVYETNAPVKMETNPGLVVRSKNHNTREISYTPSGEKYAMGAAPMVNDKVRVYETGAPEKGDVLCVTSVHYKSEGKMRRMVEHKGKGRQK